MPVSYNDPRYSYNYGPPGQPYVLTYNGTLLVPNLAGTQSSGSGSLAARLTRTHTALAGAQSYATGLLTEEVGYRRTLTGDQPYPTGQFDALKIRRRILEGEQPYPTAELVYSHAQVQILVGIQPYPTGMLATHRTMHRTFTGDQPYPTATLKSPRHRKVTLEGVQPQADPAYYNDPRFTYNDIGWNYNSTDPGYLSWRVLYKRLLEGFQPYPTGELEVVRIWIPWAKYYPYVYDRPEGVEYVFGLDSDENVFYVSSVGGTPQGVVYVEYGPHQYKEPRR